MTGGSILVGVDRSRGSSAALRYAAHEAHRSGDDLDLVHVLSDDVPIIGVSQFARLDPESTARHLLQDRAEEASRLVGPERVTTSLMTGGRVRALTDAARQARMIVIGAEQRSSFNHLMTGSTVSGVASHASCLVVVVPTEWQAQDDQHCVVVGIESIEHAYDLTLRALRLASDHDDQVLLVHAWEWPDSVEDLLAWRGDSQAWSDQARSCIAQSVSGLRAAFPSVPLEVRVVHGQAARVLQRASEGADHVILARRDHALPFGHLGSTARALLRESACPVQIVPAPCLTSAASDLVLEQAGALHKQVTSGRDRP